MAASPCRARGLRQGGRLRRDAHLRPSRRERVALAGGVASGATGGGNETAKSVMTQPDAPPVLLPPLAAYSLIAVGVAVVLVATAVIVRKRAAILAKWT